MLLYHYCSNEAFFGIVGSRRIRLSPLGLSNDAREGHHALDVAQRLLPIGSPTRNTIRDDLAESISRHQVLGFCLSEAGDLLSQWRGYADDAQGVAIGFDHEEFLALIEGENLQLQKVAYTKLSLAKKMKPRLRQISAHDMKLFTLGRIAIGGNYVKTPEEDARYIKWKEEQDELYCELAKLAYAFKSKFFEEEQEWRVYTMIPCANGVISIPNVQFLPSAQLMKPFLSFPQDGFANSLIKEVILGPRNRTPPDMARLFLNSYKFDHVQIAQSAGTYR